MIAITNLLYCILLVIGSPYLLWRILVKKKNRHGWLQKLFGFVAVRTSNAKCIWLHAVSVGEVNLLRQIIVEIQTQYPGIEFAITTSTTSGYQLAQKRYPGNEFHVNYAPSDFSWAVNRFLRRVRPSMLLLAELELWPNLIQVTRQNGIPVGIVNGRLSEKSFEGYRRFKILVQHWLRQLSFVCVQDESYAKRFIELGCTPGNVIVTGSVKYDGIITNRNNVETRRLSRLANLHGRFVLVAGSTQLEDDLASLDAYQALRESNPEITLVLVPRHPERTPALVNEIKRRQLGCVLRSELETQLNPDPKHHSIIIVDVIGELLSWWGLANAGFVGGSLGSRGGQNMIEPAGFGVPVCFGPNTRNFQAEVGLLLSNEAAKVIKNASDLEQFFRWAINENLNAREMGLRAQKLVLKQKGASRVTAARVVSLLMRSENPTQLANSKTAA